MSTGLSKPRLFQAKKEPASNNPIGRRGCQGKWGARSPELPVAAGIPVMAESAMDERGTRWYIAPFIRL